MVDVSYHLGGNNHIQVLLQEQSKQIVLHLLSSGRLLAWLVTFASQSWCHHSSTLLLPFRGAKPQVNNGITAEEENSSGPKWDILRAKGYSRKLHEVWGLKFMNIFLTSSSSHIRNQTSDVWPSCCKVSETLNLWRFKLQSSSEKPISHPMQNGV